MDIEEEEDFVFYGTPIEREEELTSRKKKAVAEASGHLRALPAWKQEVRDEEGRRRFHGAFTGGFSAGYYNTVGSKEGWTPQTFTSSRKNRAEVKQQSILNFLDDDEKSEYEGRSLRTSSQFDTFGFTAAEFALKQAEKEQEKRPSAIPGPVPEEIVTPAAESIGIKLLLQMGWRHGRPIKDSRDSLYDARREARKAFLAFSSDDPKGEQLVDSKADEGNYEEDFAKQSVNDDIKSSQSIPAFVRNPKQDLYGLGFDPYEHAPEFRDKKNLLSSRDRACRHRKALNMKDSLFGLKSGKAAPGFGIGALEEYDAEDEDIYAAEIEFEDSYAQEPEEPSRSIPDHKHRLVWKEQGVLPGFKPASNIDFQLERFDPTVIPKDFEPHHKFPAPLEVGRKHDIPPPEEVPPPEDNNWKVLIDGVATLVARCGKLFEDLSREKNQSNPSFSFLNGGIGKEYYARRLWEEQEKHKDLNKLPLDGKSSSKTQEISAETRGKILGERPLERSSKDSNAVAANVNLQFNLSDTFMKPAIFNELPEASKPFKDDPAKQERFEQFLKDKYKGGLRTTSFGANDMSEAARARERLDFEAAAEAIEKNQRGKEQKTTEFSSFGGMRFTSAEHEASKVTQVETVTEKLCPKREEYQWCPSPILCKRFDLIDPYMGKPPLRPRIRSKVDSLIKMDTLLFTSDFVKTKKADEHVKVDRDQLHVIQSDTEEPSRDVADSEITQQEVHNVERPVDLYKAIFSDDSDDEAEAPTMKKVEDPEKKIEVANIALNRLIAGDFLESLGKELGIEVPPDLNTSVNAATFNPQKGTAGVGNADNMPVQSKLSSTPNSNTMAPASKETAQEESRKIDYRRTSAGTSEYQKAPPSDNKVDSEKVYQKDKRAKSPSVDDEEHFRSSSSEDETSRKCSKRLQHKSSDSSSDSSDDDRYRSKERKKSSREKRSRRKRSKHHKHRRRDSPSRSFHYSSERKYAEGKKEKRKSRD